MKINNCNNEIVHIKNEISNILIKFIQFVDDSNFEKFNVSTWIALNNMITNIMNDKN